MSEKLKHKINWNYVATIIAIVTLVAFINSDSRTGTIQLLSTENARLRSENAELKSLNDPDWFQKFNEQTEFFKTALNKKELEYKSLIDSLNSEVEKETKETFSADELRLILHALNDLDYFKSRVEHDSSLITIQSELINNLRFVDSNRAIIIENQEKIIRNLEGKGIQSNSFGLINPRLNEMTKTISTILLLLVLVIIIYYQFIKKK